MNYLTFSLILVIISFTALLFHVYRPSNKEHFEKMSKIVTEKSEEEV